MKDKNSLQEALINIFKVGMTDRPLEELVETCHLELSKLIGEEKAKNFYLAVYMGEYNYILPYYRDEIDDDPVNEIINLKGGLTDYIRQSGKTTLINSEIERRLKSEGKLEAPVGADSFEWIGAPLKYKDAVHGVLVVQTYDDDVHYSDEDLELVDYISQNISLAIDRKNKDRELDEYKKNLEQMVREKSRELLKKNTKLQKEIAKVKKSEKIQKVLYNISEAKNNTKDLRHLLKKIHQQVSTLMEATNFYVAIAEDKEKGLFRLPFMVDEKFVELTTQDNTLDLSEGFTHYVFKSEKPLLLGQTVDEYLKKGVRVIGSPSQSWLGIPLKTPGGEVIGVVVVQSYTDPHAYTKTEKKILSIISTTIAGAVKYKQLEEEKEALEEKLLESQKMEAVGILAAGVAHEFNNLLSIIIGHAFNGMRISQFDKKSFKRYEKIEQTAERASELIDKLMVFAQKRERGRHFIENVSKAIKSILRSFSVTFPKEYRLTTNIPDDLWQLRIDRQELTDVLLNILDNALLAVKETPGGHVSISAENFSDTLPHTSMKESAKYIHIVIEDNGRGMSEDTLQQVFNPFFTTRNPGEGTGMGMAIAYTIVKEYYGSIDIKSEIDKGTAVHVYLPVSSYLS